MAIAHPQPHPTHPPHLTSLQLRAQLVHQHHPHPHHLIISYLIILHPHIPHQLVYHPPVPLPTSILHHHHPHRLAPPLSQHPSLPIAARSPSRLASSPSIGCFPRLSSSALLPTTFISRALTCSFHQRTSAACRSSRRTPTPPSLAAALSQGRCFQTPSNTRLDSIPPRALIATSSQPSQRLIMPTSVAPAGAPARLARFRPQEVQHLCRTQRAFHPQL